MKKLVGLLLIVTLSWSCSTNDDNNDPINCTEVLVAGLSVTVKDDTTDAILTDGVLAIATDGSYTETLENLEGNQVFLGAWERAGNYILTVSKQGYQTFASNAIRVTEDECHVITAEVEIRLRPN